LFLWQSQSKIYFSFHLVTFDCSLIIKFSFRIHLMIPMQFLTVVVKYAVDDVLERIVHIHAICMWKFETMKQTKSTIFFWNLKGDFCFVMTLIFGHRLCHPGPCPPCSAMSPIKRCFCGRTE
jgi:hypothetical protein